MSERRSKVLAVAAVVAAVGVGAIAFSALGSSEDDGPRADSKSDASPSSPPELRCPAESAEFGVSGLHGPSLEEVADRAVMDGEEVVVEPGAEEVRARGAVLGPGGTPRLALRFQHVEGVWNLHTVSACLSSAPAAPSCGPVVRLDGAEYALVEDAPELGVGGIVGQARVPECSTLGLSAPEQTAFDGPVFPATAYSAMEMDPAEEITMYINGDVLLLRRN